MGILDGKTFAGGELPLDKELSRQAFENLDTPVPFDGRVRSAYQLAVAHMAEEILNVAVRHGVDIRDFTLMSYGAAGPMLLPAVLELLPLKKVIVPPHPGLFSALGLLSTDQMFYDSRSAYVVLNRDNAASISAVFDEMEYELRARVGDAATGYAIRRNFDGRLLGQSWETPFIEIPPGPIGADTIAGLVNAFHDEYEARNASRFEQIPVEGVTYRVELIVPSAKVDYVARPAVAAHTLPERTITLEHVAVDGFSEAGLYHRDALCPGQYFDGPAVIREDLSTTYVLQHQRATIGSCGEIVIERNER
jgi:N-methylhydantoinase A